MPAEEKSHVESRPRSRVTDTHGPYPVGDLHVVRVGGIVAVHLGTPAGRFIFHVRERSFVTHARGAIDDQRNPWRSLEAIDAERTAEGVAPDEPKTPGRGMPMSPQRRARYIAAWIDKQKTGATQRATAEKHNLPLNSWAAWCYKYPHVLQAALREAMPPVAQPGELLA